MKDVKRRVESFSLYDRWGMEAHLAKMAEQGWLLEKIGSYLWTYRRIEPKSLAFSVCYFPTASQFDPGPSAEQETFYDFCEHTGWVLAASNAQLQIFYNEQTHPVPIETDPVQEVETIHRAMKKNYVPGQLYMLGLGLFYGGMSFFRIRRDPIGALSGASNLLCYLCAAILLLLSVTKLAGYFRWRRKAMKAAEQGTFYGTKSHRKLELGCLWLLAVGLVYFFLSVFASGSKRQIVLAVAMLLVYGPGLFLIVHGIKGMLKKKGVSKGVNRVVTFVGSVVLGMALVVGIVWGTLYGNRHGWFEDKDKKPFYTDTLPITVEDLTGDAYGGYYRDLRREGTFLLTRIEADQWPRFDAPDEREMPRLNYTVVVVKVPFLYDLCREEMFHANDDWDRDEPEESRYSWLPVDPTPWGAVEAYQWGNSYGGLTKFLLCYEDRIVELELSYRYGQTVGETGMALVGEKLGKGGL